MKIRITDWKVAAFYPYTTILGNSVEIGSKLSNLTPWVDAKVPGSIHMDLYAANLIDDPYKNMNSLSCEWIENKWWVYKTKLTLKEKKKDKRYFLRFDGIDYKAHVYVNGTEVATHENMFSRLMVDVTDLLKVGNDNDLSVVLEHAPDAVGQIGFTSTSNTQKSRFNYKWDFCARLVNLGLFKPVYLVEHNKARFEEVYIKPTLDGTNGRIEIENVLESTTPIEGEIRVTVNDHEIYKKEILQIDKCKTHTLTCMINDVSLWWPNGMGEANLYDLNIELVVNDTIYDSFKQKIGFKTLELIQNEDAPKDALPYTFTINQKKMYVKGVNITPLDALLGNINDEKYRKLIDMLASHNINFIRVWGGGVIESQLFYELCDQYGILIWQEFLQSSSGIDNIPNVEDTYLSKLKEVSIEAIKSRRNYVSLGVWCAGNELTDTHYVPSTFEDKNVNMLKKIVEKYDENRYMFPTSASGPLEFGDITKKGLNHDIHGTWRYEGPVEHYTYYNQIDSLFHGEFGVEGMTNINSMIQFLSEDNIGLYNKENNYAWRHHGGEWWDTKERDEAIFGPFENLDDHIKASQFIQGEGLRYALEANRRRAYNNSGSIIWQANEPYPNTSCTSLIDYYMQPKFAFYTIKKAYQEINPNIKYDQLIYEVGETLNTELYVTADEPIKNGICSLQVLVNQEELVLEKTYDLKDTKNVSQKLENIKLDIQEGWKSLEFSMRVTKEERTYTNHVLLLVKDKKGVCSLDDVKTFMKRFLQENK